jgi:hypothetical protein
VLVAFHPHFIIATGTPTHFTSSSDEPVAIVTHVHLLSEHVTAALDTGWHLTEMREGVVDERWLAVKPKWEHLRGHPISAALVGQAGLGPARPGWRGWQRRDRPCFARKAIASFAMIAEQPGCRRSMRTSPSAPELDVSRLAAGVGDERCQSVGTDLSGPGSDVT